MAPLVAAAAAAVQQSAFYSTCLLLRTNNLVGVGAALAQKSFATLSVSSASASKIANERNAFGCFGLVGCFRVLLVCGYSSLYLYA